jgi:hypothetical protein
MICETQWYRIAFAISRGWRPDKKGIIEALRRGEPNIPAEVQGYIADLLAGKIKRGKPASPIDDQKLSDANALVRRVERWTSVFRHRHHATNPQQRAFERVAVEHRWKNGEVAKRNYQRAKQLRRFPPWDFLDLNKAGPQQDPLPWDLMDPQQDQG